MNPRRCGDSALLVELDGIDQVIALYDALAADPPPGVTELLPAARTLLVRFDPADAGALAVRDRVSAAARAARPRARTAPAESPVVIPVVYDGEDLAEVAALTGLTVPEVVRAHTATPWTVAFCGFTPGFGYLTGGDPRLAVPRCGESRVRVPAGSIALAAGFSAVYPRESPGGWQLIGRTDVPVWDLDTDPPALLRPGTRVRFVRAGDHA
ncbi:allophanate hydrolase subunit 1 [Nonomuraea sp. NN258]|uniref:5-oxoprolinase subunit B family protein n=1 Tax=Nonomuraea antri TaxID=2730852 RepID=UPI00156804F6|nr:allophanate hydrolase subunit 1 [Nonomuraea antri]NRQ36052.1 allophanate hydrolase subunit 1 [Nonomuraea antri]